MKNKPMSLIVFAFIQFSMPVFSVLLNSWVADVNPISYLLQMMQTQTALQLLEFFTFFPIAGICIYAMKAWSYPIFIAVAGWTMLQNFFVWQAQYSSSLSILLLSNTVLLVSLVYYLHPKIRAVYFNEKLRWWESLPRYATQLQGVVINKDIREVGEILNLSMGGALIKTEWTAEVNEIVQLQFILDDFEIEIDAQVAHVGLGQFGVKFLQVDREVVSRQFISQDLIKRTLSKSDLPVLNPTPTFKQSFGQWVGDVKQGKGLLPPVEL